MDYFSLERGKTSYNIKEKSRDKYTKDISVFGDVTDMENAINNTDHPVRSDKYVYQLLRKMLYMFPFRISSANLVIDKKTMILDICSDRTSVDEYYPLFRRVDFGIEHKERKFIKVEKHEKFSSIVSTMVCDKGTEYMKYTQTCKNSGGVDKLFINRIILILKYLEKGGNILIDYYSWCNDYGIDFMYMLLMLFKTVTIHFGRYVVCYDYDPQIDVNKVLNDMLNKTIVVSPKPNLNSLISYLKSQFNISKKILGYSDKKNISDLQGIYYKMYIDYIEKTRKITTSKQHIAIMADFNKYYITRLHRSFDTSLNALVKIRAGIGKQESAYLSKTLSNGKYTRCLEVGMAFGISTLSILSAINKYDGTLISIDPNQSGHWNKMGIKLIENSGLTKWHTVIEDKSYMAMPELLKTEESKYDLVFIDGWHTFDYTLIDFFYADKLLKIGGMIIVDDAMHAGVRKTLKYIDTNYIDYYKKVGSPITFGSYVKTKNDTRGWDYHSNF